MKDNKENKDNSNLEETIIFESIKDEKDTVEIPTFTGLDTTKLHKQIDPNLENDDDILIDNSKENLKAAEEELNSLYNQQTNGNNNGNGDDPKMAKKKNGKYSRLEKLNIFLASILTLMIIGFIGAGFVWTYLNSGIQDLDIDALSNKKNSVLYDKNKEEFFDLSLYSEDGTSHKDIPYMEMDQNVIDAFISIEDARFFKHTGFDIPRFTAAIAVNLKTFDFSQGGSTLTMQLIKTSHLSADKDVKRKAQEITLSREVEKILTKDEIFEYYVNKINYGAGNSRGLENAAIFYFNKSATELNISEAALLAGVVNAPNAYSPLKDLETAKRRRNIVIDQMEYHGYIDKEEAELAKAIKIENQLTDEASKTVTTADNPYIDYVSAVIDEIYETMGIDIIATPMEVYTFMDPKVQTDISRIQNEETFTYPDKIMQSAIVTGDNETGQVIGIGAGRNSQLVKGFNRATDMWQQPGSVTKPLLSYALAFEHLGWATSHVVEDRPVQYAGTDKILGNADGRYRGEVNLKEAVARSLNTPAYLALMNVENKIGKRAVAQYLNESLGFSKVTEETYDTQHAIGGSTSLVSPMELFGAQAVMMNGGYYTKPHTVDYVITSDGEKIEDLFDYPRTKVISEETAFLVSELEANNVTSGIINRMEVLGGRPYKVYAKTGTTDYGVHGLPYGIPEGAGKDQWMMASSKEFTSVVWMGFDKPIKGEDTYWTNAKYNANPLGRMNILLLNSLHANKANPGNVTRPSGVSDITHVLSTFPYANPIKDLDSKYITSGLINSKYKNLVNLDAGGVTLEKLDGFKAELKADGFSKNLTLEWSEYPEGGAVKPETYDISLGNVKATGKRLFDISWIFGPVQYEAEVRVDGLVLDTITSEDFKVTKTLDIPNDAEVKVCGYYKNNKDKGAETCVTVTNPQIDQAIGIPAFNNMGDVNKFITDNKLSKDNFKEETVETNDINMKDKFVVTYNNQVVSGSAYKESDLKNMVFKVTTYKYVKPEEKPEGKPDGKKENTPNP